MESYGDFKTGTLGAIWNYIRDFKIATFGAISRVSDQNGISL